MEEISPRSWCSGVVHTNSNDAVEIFGLGNPVTKVLCLSVRKAFVNRITLLLGHAMRKNNAPGTVGPCSVSMLHCLGETNGMVLGLDICSYHFQTEIASQRIELRRRIPNENLCGTMVHWASCSSLIWLHPMDNREPIVTRHSSIRFYLWPINLFLLLSVCTVCTVSGEWEAVVKMCRNDLLTSTEKTRDRNIHNETTQHWLLGHSRPLEHNCYLLLYTNTEVSWCMTRLAEHWFRKRDPADREDVGKIMVENETSKLETQKQSS